MTAPLPALAAAFLPARAAAVLARHADPSLAAEGSRLWGLPRAGRLAALEEALAAQRRPSRAAREALASRERARLAAQVRAGDEAFALRPLLRRLVLERGWERGPCGDLWSAPRPHPAPRPSVKSAPADRHASWIEPPP